MTPARPIQALSKPSRLNDRHSLRLNSRLPLALLVLLAILQLLDPSRVWMGLILGLGGAVVIAYAWARTLRDHVSARRLRRGAWVLVGDIFTETFVVENSSPLPVLWAEIIDHSQLPGYRPNWVATVTGHGRQTYKTEGRCQRRGVFALGPWELRTGDPLGLFTVVQRHPDVQSVLVYPRAMHLPDLRLPRGDAAGRAQTSRRTPQTTISAASVRHYLPGDSLRRIHWRRSAHHDALMVKEFDLEPSGDLWIVLDLEAGVQAGEGAESTLEYGVTLTASLAAQMLADNRRVGLAAAHHLIPPQAGQMQLWRILEVLAYVEPTDAPLADVLRALRENVGRGRTVVVITPSAGPEWLADLLHLARRGNAPAALLLDAASFQPPPAPPAAPAAQNAVAGLRSLLAEQGAPSHLIDRDFVFRPLHPILRTRTELRTLSATGRVIAVEVKELV